MTTQTAQIIQALEAAAPDPLAQVGVLAQHPTDHTLREVLEAAYDPFLRWFAGLSGAGVVGPIAFAEAADRALTNEWAGFREMLAVTHRNELQDVLEEYVESPAWPIFARVVRKGFIGVPFDVANLWGTLPVFRCAPIEYRNPDGDDREWAYVTVPLISVRSLIVVRDPFSGPVVDFFDEVGLPGLAVHDDLRAAVERVDFSVLEADGPHEEGVVFDGFAWSTNEHGLDVFRACDLLPLARFKKQEKTAPFAERREQLRAFSERHRGGPFNVAPFVKDPEYDTKVFRIDAEAQYPYFSPSSWEWAHEGDGGARD